MIFSLIILILIGIIVFFHYTQGLWSGFFSALAAVISAVLAVSYHENLVESISGGKVADYAHAMALIGIFAFSYFLLRVIFDGLVPGNLRFPAIMDKVGGAVMGLIAALFATGVFALAAQSLPFGPSIGGYSRYPLSETRNIPMTLEAGRRQVDVDIGPELEIRSLEGEPAEGLWIPVDDMVVDFVAHLSEGTLAGNRPLASVHPDYVNELYAQRLGIQGGKHVAMPNQADVLDVYRVESVKAVDAELDVVRSKPVVWPDKPETGKAYLVVRTLFNAGAGDADDLVRLGPGSVRLVVNEKNFHPIGTMEGNMLLSNKPDDFLFIPEGSAADFVFHVNAADVLSSVDPKQPAKIKDGVFVEIKRLARHDLSGREVPLTVKPSEQLGVFRKTDLAAKIPSSASPQVATPFTYSNTDFSQKLFSAINVGTPEPDVTNAQVGISGQASLTNGKLSMLDIKSDESLMRLREGSYAVDDLYAPDGQKLVVLVGAPPTGEADHWQWADELSQFALTDSNGVQYPPHGAWAKVREGTTDKMVVRYNAAAPVPAVPRGEGRLLDVYLAFLVPSGTSIQDLTYKGQTIQTIGQQAP